MLKLNNKLLAIFLSVLLVSLSGCSEVYHYELKVIAENCGGYDKIHRIWVDLTTVRAECKNGDITSSKKKKAN